MIFIQATVTGYHIPVFDCPTHLFVQVPIKWMAPESILDRHYSSASDVWSFGVLCWEVFSLGQTPYPGLLPDNVLIALAKGYRMPRPERCPPDLYVLLEVHQPFIHSS